MAILDDLQGMTDTQLQDVIGTAGDLIESRKAAKKSEAIEQARAALSAAGLTVRDLLKSSSRKRSSGGAEVKPGQKFTNAATGETWTAGKKGRRPEWVAELVAGGTQGAAAGRT